MRWSSFLIILTALMYLMDNKRSQADTPVPIPDHPGGEYFLQDDTPGCSVAVNLHQVEFGYYAGHDDKTDSQAYKRAGCRTLYRNTKVQWDGNTLISSDLGFPAAKVSTGDGNFWYTFANSLGVEPWQDPFITDFITADGALLCMSPEKLDEGLQAMTDPKWLSSIDCVVARKGIPVRRIKPHASFDDGPWQVRVMPPGGDGVTMWGSVSSFLLPDGTMVRQ